MMSEITAENHSNDCRDSFEEEHLQEALKRVVDVLGISSPKYWITSGTKTGDNYVGVVYRVFIEGEKNGVQVKNQTVVKVPPKNELKRQALQISYFFPREHLFYTEIVPIFKQFLETKNKILENVAECYFSSIDDHKEVICLEDLKPKGFVLRDRVKQMDFAHTSIALRSLGRLHALSFALRDQEPEIFSTKIKTLKETVFRPEVSLDPIFITRCEKLGNIVKMALAEEDSKYTEIFSEFLKDVLHHLERSCDASFAEPYAVLGHGDYWVNNMLFRYHEDSTDPQDIYMLDFQLARYASPVLDLSYILFCNCSQDLREKHYDELIKIYHESLSAYLLELGSDPNKLFPYEALINQLNDFNTYGAGIAMMVIPLFVSQGDDVKEIQLDDSAAHGMEERIRRDHLFRTTLRDTYKDLIDRNYIKQ